MAVPRTETIMKRPWANANLQEMKQVTGLPTALKLYGQVSTPEENGALALFRAAIHPPLAVSERVKAALDGQRGHETLSLKLSKLKGLPGVTFIWTCAPCLGGSCPVSRSRHFPASIHTHAHIRTHSNSRSGWGFEGATMVEHGLYLLEGNDPTYRPVLPYTSGDAANQPDIHLPHLLDLRNSLRTAFSPLAAISDTTRLALLGMGTKDIDRVNTLKESFALVRLVLGHPERGNGQPTTEAERKTARRKRTEVPADVAAGGHRLFYDDWMVGLMLVRGMAMPRPQVQQAMAVVDAFHRGEE